MVLLKINKWLLFVGLSLLVISPSFIFSSNKTPSLDRASQGSGNPGSGQAGGGLGFRCGCGSPFNGNWALDWGVAPGPSGITLRFGSGVGQNPYGGGFGFGWSSSTSTGDSNSPSPVLGGGGGGGSGSGSGVSFQFGFSGGFETSPGNSRFNDVRKIASRKDLRSKRQQ
ncbi:hypothetical protein TIFTF001_008959 [Ficus carica]|uniref:Uncharacterized protein n=1 Tax=Ficus carica TaxID=3494 RepID=A0AA87ZUF5_FICCA|nr:hypothetical protein TIFTF001_008959 [Ficus carica]